MQILGVSPEYLRVRNLTVVSGRFFDQEDSQAHNKVAVITEKMARAIYGSPQAAVGKVIKLTGLPFTIIGTFKERGETFGQSEIIDNTMLIPYSVSRYFMETPSVKLLYFSMEDAPWCSRRPRRSSASCSRATAPSRSTTSRTSPPCSPWPTASPPA